jgi:hypothetical protein
MLSALVWGACAAVSPEAKDKVGNRAGLVTVLGFAVAAGLSNLT